MDTITWNATFALLEKYYFKLNPSDDDYSYIIIEYLNEWLFEQKMLYIKNNKNLTEDQIEKLKRFIKIVYSNKYLIFIENLKLTLEWLNDNDYKTLNKYVVYKEKNIGEFFRRIKNNTIGFVFDEEKIIKKSRILKINEDHRLNRIKKNINLIKEWEKLNPGVSLKSNVVYKSVNIGEWYYKCRDLYFYGIEQEDGSLRSNIGRLNYKQVKIIKNSKIFYEEDKILEMNGGHKKIYKWQTKYDALKEYVRINKKFPRGNECYNGINLGTFVNNQKGLYNRGIHDGNGNIKYNRNTISDEQIRLLEQINFDFCGNIDKFNSRIITEKNSYQIKREVYKKIMSVLENIKDINDKESINKEVIKKLEVKRDLNGKK